MMMLLALAALAAEPAAAPPAPGEVVMQQRPDRKGDAYAYAVEVQTRTVEDGKTTDHVERQRFQVGIEQAGGEELQVSFIRSMNDRPAPSGDIDVLWDRAWLDIPLKYRTTRQGTPTRILNLAEVEPAYTENMRRLLGAPKTAFLASVKARFADASPFSLAGGSSGLHLASIAFLQHRERVKLGSTTEPSTTTASGAVATRTVAFSDHDPAACRIRVTHEAEVVAGTGPGARRRTIRSTALVSTWDGWVIDYQQDWVTAGGLGEERKTTRITREGKAPGCG